jgi:hypothetical protein
LQRAARIAPLVWLQGKGTGLVTGASMNGYGNQIKDSISYQMLGGKVE